MSGDPALDRRPFLRAITGVGVLALAGCLGSSGENSGQASPELTYSLTDGTSPSSIPESIRSLQSEGGRREEGHKWVVVMFEVAGATLDMQEIWFRSRVETETRFYDLDHATEELADGVQSRGEIKPGGSAIALYQIPVDVDSYSWNLEETHQDIEAIEE